MEWRYTREKQQLGCALHEGKGSTYARGLQDTSSALAFGSLGGRQPAQSLVSGMGVATTIHSPGIIVRGPAAALRTLFTSANFTPTTYTKDPAISRSNLWSTLNVSYFLTADNRHYLSEGLGAEYITADYIAAFSDVLCNRCGLMDPVLPRQLPANSMHLRGTDPHHTTAAITLFQAIQWPNKTRGSHSPGVGGIFVSGMRASSGSETRVRTTDSDHIPFHLSLLPPPSAAPVLPVIPATAANLTLSRSTRRALSRLSSGSGTTLSACSPLMDWSKDDGAGDRHRHDDNHHHRHCSWRHHRVRALRPEQPGVLCVEHNSKLGH
ncbi:hypothetical protein Q4I28_001804 [Leishmania naiffi]|uniref:Uncharacterized protein n=1 Tax=Leishmania naiffi TaxID=5678 RepID=A0AAW3C4R9_9TRYP